jgi:hypothetical protein
VEVLVSHDEWRDELRVARDAHAVTSLLARELPRDGLQHAGDAVLAVVIHGPTPELHLVVAALVETLQERSWEGDDDLADALEHALGGRQSSLKPLGVELDAMAEALGEAGSESLLDLQTGEVWLEPVIEYSRDSDEDVDFDEPDRWLAILGGTSHESYRDMQQFIATLEDDDLAERLTDVIDGKGASHRFLALLEKRAPETLTRWHRYHEDAQIGRARSWLADQGYRAQPREHY